MEICSDVLANEVDKEFDSLEVTHSEDGCVTLRKSVTPESPFIHEEHDSLVESVKEFVLMYTEDWQIDRTNANRIEGYHLITLKKE